MKINYIKHLMLFFTFTLLLSCKSRAAFVLPSLEVDIVQIPSNVFEIEDFSIAWSDSNLQLSIYKTNQPNKILWESIAGKGWLHGAKAIDKVKESRGSFTFNEEILTLLDKQSMLSISKIENKIVITGQLFNASASTNYTLTFMANGQNLVNFDVKFSDTTFNRTYFTYAAANDESFYGFGEQCSFFNNKGKQIPIWVNEQGVGRGDITDPIINAVLGASGGTNTSNYISVPHYITNHNKSIFLTNTCYTVFDLTQTDKVQINAWTNHLNGNIISGNTPKDLITEYTKYSGRMRKLPNWINEGAVIGLQGGTEKLYDEWAKLIAEGTPIAAFWLQDWIGQRKTIVGKQLWWNWELDKERYPEWDKLVDTLDKSNIRLLGYINPFIADIKSVKVNIRRNIFEEALKNGFLVKKENGQPYLIKQTSFDAGIIDLSNPACRVWIKEIIKDEMIARGLKGWMADFGEALPFDAKLFSGESASEYHNKYTQEWVKLNREAIEESGYGEEIVFFARSGYAQSPKDATLFWQGDQIVDWGQNDGLKSAITGLLSAGISGFSLNHSDIGGYTTVTYPIVQTFVRSQELLERWIEMSAFTTVFRTHEGLNPDRNYQIYDSPATLAHFAKYAKIYKAWSFYRQQLIEEANNSGLPVVRHPFLEFPLDTNVQSIVNNQFMVGSELMVAPVIDKGSTTANIYLPLGVWVNLWNGTNLISTGQWFAINGLSDKPAVFYKNGSAIGQQFRSNLLNEGLAE